MVKTCLPVSKSGVKIGFLPVFLWLVHVFRDFKKKSKKGVDNRETIWYYSQAPYRAPPTNWKQGVWDRTLKIKQREGRKFARSTRNDFELLGEPERTKRKE